MSESDENDLLIRIGLTEKKYMQALARMESSSVKAAKKAEKAFSKSNNSFQSGATKSNRAANNFANGGLRNMSMQFSQVMQQGAVTGDYMRALAVQLPDMAIGFGAIGVAAGAFAPILFTIAQNALGASESVQKMRDSLDELAAGTVSAREEIEMLIRGLSSVEELRALQGIADLERQIAETEAEREGLSGRNLRAVEMRVDALVKEKEEAEQALSKYRETTGHLSEIKSLGQDIAGIDMGAGIRSAMNSAKDLLPIMREMANLTYQIEAKRNAEEGFGQTTGRTDWAGDNRLFWNLLPPSPDETSSKGGSGGGSKRNISEEYETLRASLDSAYSALKQYEESQELLNLALKTGAIDLAAYNSTMDLVTGKFEDATKQTELFDLSVQSTGETILDIATSGADAFDSLAQSIQRAALEFALFGKSGVEGLGTGDAGGLIGGLLTGQFEANAKGGVYNSPGLSAYSGSVVSSPTVFPFAKGAGLMGEAGPEAILPLSRGADGKLGVAASGGSSGGTSIQVNNYSGAKVETSTETGPDGQEMVRLMVSDEIGKGSFDKSMGGRYGSTVRKTKR